MSVCLSVRLSVHLSVCLSACLSVCPSFFLFFFFCLSFCLPVCLSVWLSVWLSVYTNKTDQPQNRKELKLNEKIFKHVCNHLLLLCKLVSCEAFVSSTTFSSLANTNWHPANGYMPIKQMSRDDWGQRCTKTKITNYRHVHFGHKKTC